MNEPEVDILSAARGRVVSDGGPFGRVLLPAPHHAWELPLDTLPAPADWNTVFSRTAPLAVEIGCGGGRTIMTLAADHPEWNCLGIERCGEYYRIMRDRAARRQLANFRCARIDAAFLIRRYFTNASVAEYHIYFPDLGRRSATLSAASSTPNFAASCSAHSNPAAHFGSRPITRITTTKSARSSPSISSVEEHPQPWFDALLGRTNFEVKYMQQRPGSDLPPDRAATRGQTGGQANPLNCFAARTCAPRKVRLNSTSF